MAAHVRLKKEFTEDGKCHNHTTWLHYSFWCLPSLLNAAKITTSPKTTGYFTCVKSTVNTCICASPCPWPSWCVSLECSVWLVWLLIPVWFVRVTFPISFASVLWLVVLLVLTLWLATVWTSCDPVGRTAEATVRPVSNGREHTMTAVSCIACVFCN